MFQLYKVARAIIWLMSFLIVTEEQVDKGLRLLEKTIGETCKKFGYPKTG